jgi:hypothetical protein
LVFNDTRGVVPDQGVYPEDQERLVHATDIGVSYFLVGVIAVLAYRIPRPW